MAVLLAQHQQDRLAGLVAPLSPRTLQRYVNDVGLGISYFPSRDDIAAPTPLALTWHPTGNTIDGETFEAAQSHSERKRGSRSSPLLASGHPSSGGSCWAATGSAGSSEAHGGTPYAAQPAFKRHRVEEDVHATLVTRGTSNSGAEPEGGVEGMGTGPIPHGKRIREECVEENMTRGPRIN